MSTVPIVPQDTAGLLIDHQEGILALSRTTDVASLRTTAIWLPKLARLFDIPVVLSTALIEAPTRVTPAAEAVRLLFEVSTTTEG